MHLEYDMNWTKLWIVLLVLVLIVGSLGATVADQSEVRLGWPITTSLIIGFGSGSAAIGDHNGAVFGAAVDGIGLGSAIIGAFGLGIDWFGVGFGKGITGDTSSYEITTPLGKLSAGMIIGGGAVIAVSRVLQVIRTTIWGVSNNKKIREQAALDVALVPHPASDRIVLKAKISF